MKVLKKIMLIFAAGALFAACSEELETVDPNGSFDEGTTIPPTTLSLSVPAMGQPSVSLIPASTRGEGEEAVSLSLGEVGTRAGDKSATDAECAVKNLWILQFDGSGKLAYKEIITDGLSGITASASQTTLAVPLKGYDACTLYAIANVGSSKFADAAIGTYELSTLESENYGVSATLIDNINTSGLPMAASWTGQTKDPSAYTETTAPKFDMKRMVAKVSFTCQVACEVSGHSFSLESIQLCSVPSTTTYKAGVTGTPATTATFVDYAIESSATTDKAYVWYMPENLRGEGGNTGGLATGKGESTAPTRSTYVEVKGKYSTGSETSDVTFRIFPGANETNDFNIKRNCKYTMKATIVGISETDSRVIIAVDLCKNPWLTGDQTETANCYMVSKAGCTYKFNARVMGNGKETAKCSITANNAPAITPVPLDPKSVRVLWETSGANKIIKDVDLKSDGWVYFTTAGESGGTLTEGNAVIAVYTTDDPGSNDNVLWSWHIWSTSYDPSGDGELDEYITRTGTATTSAPYKMMQRNLGASNNKDGDLGSYGLLYQWGRKDPFIGANGTSSTTPATTYGLSWPAAVGASSTTSGTGATNRDKSIDYAIKHPMTFITQAATTYDWLNATAIADQRDNLWGNPNTSTSTPTVTTVNKNMTKKSIYDPCPPGFSVPPQDAWTYFTTSGNNVTSGAPSGCNVDTSYGFKLGWKFFYQSGKSVYYPAAGYRDRTSGALTNVGASGNYWSSSSYCAGNAGAGDLSFTSGFVYPLSSPSRAYGLSVRCVQNNQ